MVLVVEDKMFQKAQEYPDQVPYIVLWKDLVPNPSQWVKSFFFSLANIFPSTGTVSTLVMGEWKQEVPISTALLHPILQDSIP